MPASITPNDGKSSGRRHAPAIALASGGLVLGAAAIGILVSGGAGEQGDDGKDQGAVATLPRGDNLLLPLPPTVSPVQSPSSFPSESSSPSLIPSAPPSLSPTPIPSPSPSGQPSTRPSLSLAPTYYPTTKEPSNSPTAKPTDLLQSLSSTGRFRLRLHWQPGFEWQEELEEKWFCMACASCDDSIFDKHCDIEESCREGMSLALINCDPSKKKNRRKGGKYVPEFTIDGGESSIFSASNRLDGNLIRVVGTTLCLERQSGRNITLQHCNASSQGQKFLGFHTGGQAMELLPAPGTFIRKRSGFIFQRCLTQHHHPRQGERIYSEQCDKARRSDTNLWSTY